jgi:hypothetical protein
MTQDYLTSAAEIQQKKTHLERITLSELVNGYTVVENTRVYRRFIPRGPLRIVVIKNPCIDTHAELNPCIDTHAELMRMIDEKEIAVPNHTNAYEISDFIPDAQFLKDGKMYSAYALKFYTALRMRCEDARLLRLGQTETV